MEVKGRYFDSPSYSKYEMVEVLHLAVYHSRNSRYEILRIIQGEIFLDLR